MPETKTVALREEIPAAYTWNMEDLYESDSHWEEEYKQFGSLLEQLAQAGKNAAASAQGMYEYLSLADRTEHMLEQLHVYANQRLHQDMTNAHYQGYAGKIPAITSKLLETEAFFEPALLEMEEAQVEQFFKDNKQLERYRIFIQNILRRRAHTLSAPEEAVLAASHEIADAPEDIFMLLNNADFKFGIVTDEDGKTLELTHGRYIGLLQSHKRSVRKEAFEKLYAVYGQFQNTLTAAYLANIKKAAFYAKMRKYPSPLAYALDTSQIPTEVYDNLITAVRKHLPAMYRYVSLRKQVLGVETLHMYDVYAPLVKDYEIKVPYEQAKQMVLEGLAPMGEDYLSHLQEGFDNRWIDVYENRGKRSGAYSWGAYGTHPYVLLNYDGRLEDVFTLAHEMGHALHTWYSNQNQPYTYAGYRIFVAEVASTCNESLLMQHLLKNSKSTQEKAYLLNHFIDQFKGTLFRQTMFAEFEKCAHEMYAEGEAVTPETLCGLYMKLNQDYFGPDMAADEQIALEWARIPHFYNEFYVYQYATGFSAAVALSRRILEEGECAVSDYIKFLSGGSSKDPIALLKLAGVDLSSPEPVEQALILFEELVENLSAILTAKK